jgi:hypothetical protein
LGLGFVDARGEEALLFHWRSHLFGESPSEREREREIEREISQCRIDPLHTHRISRVCDERDF